MWPCFPGSIGSFVQEGVVQPQEAFTDDSMSGWSPLLVNTNLCSAMVPSSI